MKNSEVISEQQLLGRKKCFVFYSDIFVPRQYIKKQRHHFADKSMHCQTWFFQQSSMDVWAGQ